jgi:hypothetical protein
MSQFEEISNDEFRQSFHETIKNVRNLCDQDKINEDNDERKKDHENVGFYKILIVFKKYF